MSNYKDSAERDEIVKNDEEILTDGYEKSE